METYAIHGEHGTGVVRVENNEVVIHEDGYNNRVGGYLKCPIPWGVGKLNVATFVSDNPEGTDYQQMSVTCYCCYEHGSTLTHVGTVSPTQETDYDISRYSGSNVLLFAYDRQVPLVSREVLVDVTGNYLYDYWYFDGEKDFLIDSTPSVGKRWEKPYPLWLWRFEAGVDDGDIFHWLLPMVKSVQLTSPENDIYIYDMSTPQSQFFESHGLALLEPISCEITEELNGEYSVTMEHPIDAEGKWRYILEMNILKVQGQLFVINRIVDNSPYGTITAYADHITYHLNDQWIWPGSNLTGMTTVTAFAVLDNIMRAPNIEFVQKYYDISYSANLQIPSDWHEWDDIKEGMTPYAAILGSSGLLAKFGGELFRDNFRISIAKEMEGARKNSFELYLDRDIRGIRRNIDLTTYATYFRGYDQFGQFLAVSWAEGAMPRAFPHGVFRSANFNIPEPYSWETLERNVFTYFEQICAPLIQYELDIKDLRFNRDFKGLENLPRFKVGDSGKLYDTKIQSWVNLKITKTVTNGLTGEVLEVVVGNRRSFTRPSGYSQGVSEYEYDVRSSKYQLRDKDGKMLYDSEYKKMMVEIEEGDN